MEKRTGLPEGFLGRAARSEDAGIVADLIMQTDNSVYFEPETVERDISDEWREIDLANDSWLVFAADGTLAACATLTPHGSARLDGFATVRPDLFGVGIGGSLIARIEDRALEHATRSSRDANLYFVSNATNGRAARLLSRLGYERVRCFLTMELVLEDGDRPPVRSDGFRIRSFVPDEAEAIYQAEMESFEDHWHGEDEVETFEEWSRHNLKRWDHDPSLWFVAEEGGEIAGISLCTSRSAEVGWVDILGVRRPWRGRGLGEALLRHSLAEFRRKGKRKAGLGVDSESLTGATRLYERVGMEVVRQSVLYRKVIDPRRTGRPRRP